MSIINQTLRELDARKTDSASLQIPLRPVAAATRRGPALWVAAAALLPIAGLALWLMPRHAEPLAPARPDAALRAPPPVAAAPEQAPARAQPATPAAEIPVKPAVAKTREQEGSDSGSASKLSGLSLTMKLSSPVEGPAAIRKVVNTATAEEEAEERYRKAVSLVQKGRENQARPLLEEAVRLSPSHVAARQTLATLLSEAGQGREAEAVLREGRAVAPENAWFALSLARLQAARGDAEGAVATLLSGVEGRGVNAEYHATLAALLMRLKHHAEAEQHYQQALKGQPDQGTWWMGLGLSLDAQGKSDEARSAYGRALTAANLPEKLVGFVRAKLAE